MPVIQILELMRAIKDRFALIKPKNDNTINLDLAAPGDLIRTGIPVKVVKKNARNDGMAEDPGRH